MGVKKSGPPKADRTKKVFAGPSASISEVRITSLGGKSKKKIDRKGGLLYLSIVIPGTRF
jgi:hypothetical protein